jgi:hypothetical protein
MMQALSQFRAGTPGATGTALCSRAYGCPHFAGSTGDTGDEWCAGSTAVPLLSPPSPVDQQHWGQGKPLCSKAVPTVPSVPTQNTGGEYAC